VFRLNYPKKFSPVILHTFDPPNDGSLPVGNLAYHDGNFYGVTLSGGSPGLGTIYQENRETHQETVLYSFQGGSDGSSPDGRLIYHEGTLYGITSGGGGTGCHHNGCGTVFSIDLTSGIESVLYAFKGGVDGTEPVGGLVYRQGMLYGTTELGGTADLGTVFRVSVASGAEQVVYSFLGGADGASPRAALTHVDGVFYGTTCEGGASDYGTFFSLDAKAGTESVLYAFKGGADGACPVASVLYQAGSFYGTTLQGGNICGNPGCGTIYSVTAAGVESVLYAFGSGFSGKEPASDLIFADDGFIGTTVEGGGTGCDGSGCGTIFRLIP
jgi:uncharacterized repeat protein (TIGR03803 family)